MSHKFIGQDWNHDLGPAEWKPDPEAALDRKEFWETFRSCLDKLPERVADVFMLREMDELDTAQICEALRISENNLWVMLHRGRMALRECLQLNWLERKSKMKTGIGCTYWAASRVTVRCITPDSARSAPDCEEV